MIMGSTAEELFRKIMTDEGSTVLKSSTKQDIYDHIDFLVDGKSYDVKGEKRLQRDTDDVDDSIWLEKMNVRGKPGWVYGKADYIAFLIKNEFWIVDRAKLATYLDTIIECDTIFPIKRYKKWYRRAGRKDIITYVYPRDIAALVIRKIAC